MNDNLFGISLNQGKQFTNYQSKIKKNNIKPKSSLFKSLIHEAFTQPDNSNSFYGSDYASNKQTNASNINTANQLDLAELQQLQSQYQTLMQQYSAIEKTIGDGSLDAINRTSNANPYLEKNVLFTDGIICYVTNQGVARPYPTTDIYNNTAGKNGCPSQSELLNLTISWNSSYIKGSIIPLVPSLIVGPPMVQGESCSNAGKNVYASRLIDNPNSTYIGCYNDKPQSTTVNIVPIMNSTNGTQGFISNASSIFVGNNESFGSWASFDQNPNTFWNSETSSKTGYNNSSGIYEGTNSIFINGLSSVSGEFLQISMPGFNTTSVQPTTVLQYSISPRLGGYNTIRSPNSWYIVGSKDNQWYKVDRQINQQFTNNSAKTYNIITPEAYGAYMILIDKVGNDDQTNDRVSVQIAEWNLYTNSDMNITSDKRAMVLNSDMLNYGSFDTCQQYAVDNEYKYFGLQNVRTDGTAQCLTSNDLSRTKMYGDATTQSTAIPIWSSGTQGQSGAFTSLTNEGQFVVYNSSGTVIFATAYAPADCKKTYSVSNNVDSPYSDIGYFDNKSVDDCKLLCNNDDSCAGFAFNKLTGNSCWLKTQITLSSQNANNDRDTYARNPTPQNMTNCVFFATLLDDGNFCVYRGKEPGDIRGGVWGSDTNGKQKNGNPDWVAIKGKYGRNYLKIGEGLVAGEWIGSTDGSLQLIMQSDGNLVLYTSETRAGCSKGLNDKTYGSSWVNAVYEMNSTGNKSSLGKVGYVDSNNYLREYPNSMLDVSNEYQIYNNADSAGNDISSLSVTDQIGCQTSCNNNNNCLGYVYQDTTNTCWLKNSSTYPTGNKQPATNSILGVRKPALKSSTTCNNQIIDIDTIQYENYVKGQIMDPGVQCNATLVSPANRETYDNVKSELLLLGQQISLKMENLYTQNNKIYEQMNMNATQFKTKWEMYKNTNVMIKNEMNKNEIKSIISNNIKGMKQKGINNIGMNKEGMQNLNINDIDGMLTDADLIVIQENYSYAFWSILAIVILIVAINTMKN